jgi:hypothetical protein
VTGLLLGAIAANPVAAQTARLVTGDEPWLSPAGATSAALTTEGAVQIRSITPPPTQPLTAGQRLRITVEVSYTLPRPQGRLALAFQEPSPTRRPLGAAVADVTQAEGQLTLSADLVVPDAPTLEVYVPLYARDEVATAVVDTRRYRILRRH